MQYREQHDRNHHNLGRAKAEYGALHLPQALHIYLQSDVKPQKYYSQIAQESPSIGQLEQIQNKRPRQDAREQKRHNRSNARRAQHKNQAEQYRKKY